MKATMNVFLALLVLAIAGSLTACDYFTEPTSYSAFHPDSLMFEASPTSAQAGSPMSGLGAPGVVVLILNGQSTDFAATDTVTIAIGTNPSGGTLSGKTSVAAVNGQAIFSNLIIDKPGKGYTLV